MAKIKCGFVIDETKWAKFYKLFSKKVGGIPMIPDPENPEEPPIPQFASEKERVDSWLWGEAKRACGFGREMIKKESVHNLDGDLDELKEN